MPVPTPSLSPPAKLFHSTKRGEIYHGDSLAVFRDTVEPASVDLIMTSPPFGLVRKKDYGNVDAEDYVQWLCRSLPNTCVELELACQWLELMVPRTG